MSVYQKIISKFCSNDCLPVDFLLSISNFPGPHVRGS